MTLSSRSKLVIGGLIVLSVLGIVWLVLTGLQPVSATDDAFVDADIVTVSAEASGTLKALHVQDNAHVAQGAALLDIDTDSLQLQLDAAHASQDEARAQADAIKSAGGDRAKAADAELRLAGVKVQQAQLALDKAHVTAPIGGTIAHRMVSVGDSVHAGQPLLALVGDTVWITANIKEIQLKSIKPGDQADVTIDAYPDLKLKAHVDSIQPGAGQAFSLLPAENASGNFVKVVQRVPVKLVLDTAPARTLSPGLSARVRIHAR